MPIFQKFIDDLRAAFADGPDTAAAMEKARSLLEGLVADEELRARSKDWPSTEGHKNLLLYEDPDYGFVINALIKQPGGRAMVHDHGPSWTIYGLLQGTERIVRYDATARPDGKYDIAETHSTDCGPGDVDIVPPGEIHSEYAGDETSIAVIVRSQRSGTFEQFRYLDDGTQVVISGPEQIPYDLSQ